MELIRKMVHAMEEAPGYAPLDLSVEGYTPAQIGYHAYLMVDAGLAEGDRMEGFEDSGPIAILYHLTWQGHEFAELSREEGRWQKAMELVKKHGGAITISALTQVLTQLMKTAVGIN
jgi:hypothetical protein